MNALKAPRWVVNPAYAANVTLHSRKKDGEPLGFEFPVNEAYKDYFVALAKLSQIPPGEPLPKALHANLEIFKELGLVVASDLIPTEVRPSWKASIKDLKHIPSVFRWEAQARLKKNKLRFNRKLVHFQAGNERPPSEIHGIPSTNTFPEQGPLVWVFNPQSQMWAVFEFGSRIGKALKGLSDDTVKVSQLDEPMVELLVHAGILGETFFEQKSYESCKSQVRHCQRQIRTLRYTVFRKMINPLQIAIARSYFEALQREGYLQIDDSQVVFKRYCRHNDPVLRYIHRQSGELVRKITGEAVLPSYSFLSAYMEGAHLARHTDRPQCVWNGSLLFEQIPEVNVEESWPIYLEIRGKAQEVKLDFGDAVFYSGTEIPHWRERNKPGHRQTLGLLHYVPISFVGSLD